METTKSQAAAQAAYRTRKRASAQNKWFGLLLCAAGVVLIANLWMERGEPAEKRVQTPAMTLNPIVENSKNLLIEQAAAKGISILISDGFRSAEEQDRLFEQGRTASGSIVTNARGGESYHNYGLAIDFALLSESGDVLWDLEYDGNGNGASDWTEVAELAKSIGFEWGGDWDNPDYPHLEMSFGLSIRELQRGKQPPVE